MASPLPTRKTSVDLAAPAVRVSRIRRDPPPVVKEISAAEIKDREARNLAIGIAAIALALLILLVAITNAAGWSPGQYSINIRD